MNGYFLEINSKRCKVFCYRLSLDTGSFFVVNRPKFMVELEPYSFEPMRESSRSEEEEASEGEDSKKGNSTWSRYGFCVNWEEQQEKECICCLEVQEALNKISGELIVFKTQ